MLPVFAKRPPISTTPGLYKAGCRLPVSMSRSVSARSILWQLAVCSSICLSMSNCMRFCALYGTTQREANLFLHARLPTCELFVPNAILHRTAFTMTHWLYWLSFAIPANIPDSTRFCSGSPAIAESVKRESVRSSPRHHFLPFIAC